MKLSSPGKYVEASAYGALALAVVAQVACTGTIAGNSDLHAPPALVGRGGGGGGTVVVPPPPPADLVAVPSGARMLSPSEYDNTLRDLLGDDTRPGSTVLPDPASDRHLPFENDYPTKTSSDVLVQAVEKLATEAAGRAVARPEVLARIVPCKPARPDDRACFVRFLEAFGRRALRRPLQTEELEAWSGLLTFAAEKSDFTEGVRLAVTALLQHPEFLFRMELGREVPGEPGLFRLDGFEVAARLSFFLIGSTPDDDLLAAAAAGALSTPEGVASTARKLLATPGAKDRLFQMHAEWLGFARLDLDPALVSALYAETRALIDEVVFRKNADYRELLTSDRTYIDDGLARHYGLPAPGRAAWVPYGASGRAGLLSQGSFLAAFSKPADTSPVNRGLFVSERLLCRHVPDPPPDVNVDELPETHCRREMFEVHLDRGASCAGCHRLMDPVGFGLENYDRTGRYRAHEDGKPECTIEGSGELMDLGAFEGPGELGRLIANSGEFEACVVRHVFQFAAGRVPGTADEPVLAELSRGFQAGGRKLADLLVAVVAHPSFGFRKANTP